MKKLCILLDQINSSQLYYELAESAKKNLDKIDTMFFVNNLHNEILAEFPVFQVIDCYNMETATVVATDLNTAAKAASFPGRNNKNTFFYVYDLFWKRRGNHNYSANAAIFRHPNLTLVARTKEIAEIISQCWNVKNVLVNETGDVGGFIQ